MSPPAFVKDISFGLLIGTYGILLLYGVTVMQVYLYYTNYPKDPLRLKVMVAIILILESVNLALACHYIYYYLIEHYGEPQYLIRTMWSVWLSDEIGFIVAWMVNMFFVRRIYVLSGGNIYMAIFIGALATIRPAFGFVATSKAYSNPLWTTFHQNVQWMFITGLSVGLSADFLIAAAISYYLIKGRENTIRSTRNVVNVLLLYTINTTAILTLFAVTEMVFLLVQPNTLTFLGLFQIQIQLYANCFLASLNARQSMRKEPVEVTPMVTLETGRTTRDISRLSTTEIGVKSNPLIISGSVPNFGVEKANPV